MKALVLSEVGKIKIEEIKKPAPQKGQALIKVDTCGICGSDIPRAYVDGAHNMPLVIGHEFSGTVEEVGEAVDSKWKGKRVGIFPLIPCKKCNCCKSKNYEMCKNYSYLGSRENGGFAEYVAVPEWNLIELPEEVSLKQAALLEPMAVAVHAIRQALSKKENLDKKSSKVAVMGLGTIGLFVTMFLKDMGFENVYTIGNKDSQFEMIKTLGIDEDDFCDVRIWDEIDWLRSNTNFEGVDLFFECVGSARSLNSGIYSAAPGGVICTVGNPREDMDVARHTYWQILRNQLTLIGTWNSSFTHDTDDDWHYVLDRLKSGDISPEQLITHEFALENIISGFELMRDKKEEYIKVIMN